MQKILAGLLFLCGILSAETLPNLPKGEFLLSPPPGYSKAKIDALSPKVKLLLVSSIKSNFPPSINLGIEPYPGTIDHYVKMVKRINSELKCPVMDLGSIETKAGLLRLLQVDTKNAWGDVTLLHAVTVKDRTVYVLTAASLKKEFAHNFPKFMQCIRSSDFSPDIWSVIDPSWKNEYFKLLDQHDQLAKKEPALSRKEIFEQEQFQTTYWIPFLDTLFLLPEAVAISLMEKVQYDLTTPYE